MNLLKIVIKNMRQRALATWLTGASVMLGVALAVAILLITNGVTEKNVEIDSLENNEPRGGGKAKDRRVEIQVAPADME